MKTKKVYYEGKDYICRVLTVVHEDKSEHEYIIAPISLENRMRVFNDLEGDTDQSIYYYVEINEILLPDEELVKAIDLPDSFKVKENIKKITMISVGTWEGGSQYLEMDLDGKRYKSDNYGKGVRGIKAMLDNIINEKG